MASDKLYRQRLRVERDLASGARPFVVAGYTVWSGKQVVVDHGPIREAVYTKVYPR